MIQPRLIDFLPAHMGEGREKDGEAKLRDGVAWSAVQGERLLGSAGLVFVFGPERGMGHAWVNCWPRDRRLMLWFSRTIRQKLMETVHSYRLHRVEATVIAWDQQGRDWIESLGFVPEGLMQHYTPEGDHVLRYAVIFKEYLPQRKEAAHG